MPPVVDPIHYGIHSAEPLWPIRGSKLPPFRLPPEAMLAAASNDRRWRPQPASKPKDVTLPRTSIQPSRQRLDHVSNLQVQRPVALRQQHQEKKHHQHPVKPQYLRHPVKSTAWKSYDRSTNRPIGRSPAVVPSLQLPAVTSRPSGHHWARHQASNVRQNFETRAFNRFFSGASSGRSFGNAGFNLESGRSSKVGISNNVIHSTAAGQKTESRSIDRVDQSAVVPLLLDQQSVRHEQINETVLSQPATTTTPPPSTNHQQRKRARRPFSPLEFVIQQGHSRVRKYGIEK